MCEDEHWVGLQKADMSTPEAAAAEQQHAELASSIQETDSEIAGMRAALDANDAAQASVQQAIDAAIDGQRAANPQLLKTLKQFRLQARPPLAPLWTRVLYLLCLAFAVLRSCPTIVAIQW